MNVQKIRIGIVVILTWSETCQPYPNSHQGSRVRESVCVYNIVSVLGDEIEAKNKQEEDLRGDRKISVNNEFLTIKLLLLAIKCCMPKRTTDGHHTKRC